MAQDGFDMATLSLASTDMTSNMSSKIPKITAETSNLAPRWPPRAPKMAPETSNLVQQSSKMPSATCTKPCKLRYERHLLVMATIFALLRLFNLKLATKFATKASKMAQDGFILAPKWPKTTSRRLQQGPIWLRNDRKIIQSASQTPMLSPRFRFPKPSSSNISSTIPKIVPKISNMAPRRPPTTPRVVPQTSNLGHQSSKMPLSTKQMHDSRTRALCSSTPCTVLRGRR